MVEVKLGELIMSRDALSRFLRLKLPVKASYRLGRAFQKISTEIEQFERVRLDLIESMGVDAENGGKEIPKDKFDEFRDVLQTLLDETITLEINQVPLEMLEGAEIEVGDVIALHFLFTE
jgi:hypothetical protein